MYFRQIKIKSYRQVKGAIIEPTIVCDNFHFHCKVFLYLMSHSQDCVCPSMLPAWVGRQKDCLSIPVPGDQRFWVSSHLTAEGLTFSHLQLCWTFKLWTNWVKSDKDTYYWRRSRCVYGDTFSYEGVALLAAKLHRYIYQGRPVRIIQPAWMHILSLSPQINQRRRSGWRGI